MSLSDAAIRSLILFVLLAVPSAAYVANKFGESKWIRARLAFILLALLLALVAFVGTVAYAIPALFESQSATPFVGALLEEIAIWSICLRAWLSAFRFINPGRVGQTGIFGKKPA